MAYLYTKSVQRKVKNFVYNSIKNNKIVGNKLNQSGERLYTNNYKTLMKEIEEDINKWKNMPCRGLKEHC